MQRKTSEALYLKETVYQLLRPASGDSQDIAVRLKFFIFF